MLRDSVNLAPWLVRLVVMVSVPMIGCLGYYLASDIGVNGWRASLAAFAFPLLLVLVIVNGIVWRSPRINKRWKSGALLCACLILVLWVLLSGRQSG